MDRSASFSFYTLFKASKFFAKIELKKRDVKKKEKKEPIQDLALGWNLIKGLTQLSKKKMIDQASGKSRYSYNQAKQLTYFSKINSRRQITSKTTFKTPAALLHSIERGQWTIRTSLAL
jgi:hypothetical protein